MTNLREGEKLVSYYLYVFPSPGEVISLGEVTISSNYRVKEFDTPLEDYGDYLLSKLPSDNPWKDWISLI